MRIRSIISSFGLAAAVVLAGGCSSKAKSESALLAEEAGNLRAQLADRNAALEAADTDRRDLALQNAELRRQLDEAAAGSMGATTGFEGIEGVSSNYANGEVTVTIASDVLFDSGRATLKTNAKQSLQQVASVLKSQYGGNTIRIAGHTDTDPIQKSGWKSNYHLGAERAYSVMEFLQGQGVATDLMHIASYGPSQPAGSKAQSRRVEIAVLMNQ
jgi:flagellar motor protein MotB